MALPAPPKRNIQSVRNWVEGNGSIVREETAYLEKSLDLVSASRMDDDALSRLQTQVEVMAVRVYQVLGLVSFLQSGFEPLQLIQH